MARREKVHALVLSRRNVGEADRLVTLLARDHGLLRVMAKGVRRIPSRRGGHLEPLTRVFAVVSGSPHHRYLSVTETLSYYQELRQSELALSHARRMAMLIPFLFEEEEPLPELYDAIEHAWQVLPELSVDKQAALEVAVVWLALRHAGLVPRLTACVSCAVQQPADAVVLTAQEGGWRCLSCHASFRDTQFSLAPRLLRALRFMVSYPERALSLRLTPEEAEQLVLAARYYISHLTRQPAFL